MKQIFILYPAVHATYEEKVPLELSEELFWRKYLESEYFHRDRGKIGMSARNNVNLLLEKNENLKKSSADGNNGDDNEDDDNDNDKNGDNKKDDNDNDNDKNTKSGNDKSKKDDTKKLMRMYVLQQLLRMISFQGRKWNYNDCVSNNDNCNYRSNKNRVNKGIINNSNSSNILCPK